MDTASSQLSAIVTKCTAAGINPFKISGVKLFLEENSNSKSKIVKIIVAIFVVCIAIHYVLETHSERCLVDYPKLIQGAFRPPEKCDFCRNIDKVDKVREISPAEFDSKYAYSGAPVIVEDATKNWTALLDFDYWFFRDVYLNAKRKQQIRQCQFLPYKTGFRDIFEALDMPDERVNFEQGTQPWYFGWSNCNPETAEILRRHYGRPYFLPDNSENNAVDWIFIGTAGMGAHMHIDNVRLPSWQAQLSGQKRWILAPPPECFFQCQRFETIVEPGQIIVLDTNRWFHQTIVLPGNQSITIGAEFD